jgi:DNA-binding PadR family transcriptional regulator
MLDKVLLGFLWEGPKTAYELAKDLEAWPTLGLSASQGSIHPALQSLLKGGLVRQAEERDGGRTRKAYTELAEGRRVFLNWLASPIPLPRGRDEATPRLLFLRHLPREERAQVWADYVERLGAAQSELKAERKARKASLLGLSPEERGRAEDELLLIEWTRGQMKWLSKWHKKQGSPLMKPLKDSKKDKSK